MLGLISFQSLEIKGLALICGFDIIGDPDDLIGLVVFLASAASDYMYGSVVPIDGGWLSR